jgi:aquaporin NIP
MMHKLLAEMIGTFTMVFVGAGSILLTEKYPNLVPAIVIPIAWGSIITLMIIVWGGISGAHFNPAVTLAFVAAKRFPISMVPVYWGSQFLGGLTAMTILTLLKKG